METVLEQKDERGVKAMLLEELDLAQVLDRDVEHLSGARHTLPWLGVFAASLRLRDVLVMGPAV